MELLRNKHIVQIACGRAHTLALTSSRDAWGWGAGVDGQLGNGQLVDIPVPERIASLQELDVRAVACGFDFSMCVTMSGEVLSWGRGDYGQLGQGCVAQLLRPTVIKETSSVSSSVPIKYLRLLIATCELRVLNSVPIRPAICRSSTSHAVRTIVCASRTREYCFAGALVRSASSATAAPTMFTSHNH